MNRQQILQRFPNASEAFIRANIASSVSHGAEPERTVFNEPVEKGVGEKKDSGRFFVSIESRRVRLLDPDNLCPKYFIDCCRYAGLIPGDRPQDIDLSITQTKVKKGDECTLIEITAL